MTMLTLLAIVQTISTLIATIFTVLAFRRSQPRQTPVANHPASRLQRMGLWLSRAAPWVLVLSALMSVWNLVSVFHSPKPLNRLQVLVIALSLSVIMLNVAFLTFMFALREIDKRLAEHTRIDRSLLEIIEDVSKATKTGDLGILELIKNLATDLRAAVEPPPKPPKPEPPERR